ncbi:MAG: M24 family metallopeptidase [Lachnospiraceae bacterium]|nr:M24 family metallopeptidase [Lachnospiraceae bacterium]
MGYAKYAVKKSEMDRRHEVTCKKMKEAGIDCLVMYSFDRTFGGALRYLTGQQVTLYPLGATFSADGDIGLYGWGALGSKITVADDNFPGKYNCAFPYFPNMYYSDEYIASEMCRVIKENHYHCVGFCHMNNLPAVVYEYLKTNLPDVNFVNASDLIDRIQAIKSDYEMELYQYAVDVQDRILAAVPMFTRPGVLESDIAKRLRALAFDMDCEEVNVMIGTSHQDAPVFKEYFKQNEEIVDGDNVSVLVEVAAPGGLWAESGRVFSLGKPSEAMLKVSDDALELQKTFAEKLLPGAAPTDILHELDDELVRRGYGKNTMFCSHGQGLDIVQRPVFVEKEDMLLEENMFLAFHPQCVGMGADGVVFASHTDNYVVTKDGGKRMCRFPQGIIQI